MKLKRLLYMSLFGLMVASCSKKEDDNLPEETNHPPTIIESQAFGANEDIDHTTIIGIVEATDDDDDALYFSIATNSDGLFGITSDGKLSLLSGKSLDYEAKPLHTLVIKVDDGTDSDQEEVTILVHLGVTNQSPHVEDQSFEVAENIGDTDVIGAVDATDEDTLEFSITNDASGLFEINAATGEIALKAGESLDFETTTEYTLTVSADDKVNDPVTAQITITVTDIQAEPTNKDAFVTTWETPNNNEAIYLGLNLDYAYDFQINWGDGQVSNAKAGIGLASFITHQYETPGTYSISIVGTFPSIVMAEEGATPLSLKSIDQWGAIQWQTMAGAFQGCTNMVYNATDTPDFSQVQSMSDMFKDATSFNGAIGNWDVSNIQFMTGLFEGATAFDQDLGGWSLESMFSGISFTDSGMSAQNYSNTLIGWSQEVFLQDVSVYASNIYLCDTPELAAALDILATENQWIIFKAGFVACQ